MNFKQRFHLHEQWVEEGNTDNTALGHIPAYVTLMSQDGDSYLYARQCIASLIIDNETNARIELDEILEGLKALNKKQYIGLCEYFNKEVHIDRFFDGSQNIRETFKFVTPEKLSQAWTYFYQLFYELNPLHEFLLVIAIYLKTGEVDLDSNKFRDSKGNVQKGAMYDYLLSAYKNYDDILNLIKRGYNSIVRNSIGHNNFRIENEKLIVQNGDVLSQDMLTEMIYCIQALKNVMLNILSSQNLEDPNVNAVGTISVKYGFFEDDVVAVQFYKLWCFKFENTEDISPVEYFDIQQRENGMCTYLDNKVQLCGPISSSMFKKLTRNIKEKGYVVYLHHLKPVLDEPSEKVEIIDDVMYDVLETQQYQFIK